MMSVIYFTWRQSSQPVEKNPERAHHVNVDGTMNVLQLAYRIGKRTNTAVKVLFPSTIAAYGIADLDTNAWRVRQKKMILLRQSRCMGSINYTMNILEDIILIAIEDCLLKRNLDSWIFARSVSPA